MDELRYTQTQKYAMPQVVAARIFMTLTFDLKYFDHKHFKTNQN